MRRLISLLSICALSVFAVTVHAQNLVGNGSFEQPTVGSGGNQFFPSGSVPHWEGWIGNCGSGTTTDIELWDNGSAIPVAKDGVQHLEISANEENETVCQTVATKACESTISFWYTGRPGLKPNGDPFDNNFGFQLSGSIGFGVGLSATPYNPSAGSDWKLYTKTFTPTDGLLTIAFYRNSDDVGGAHIDNVTLTQNCPIAADHLYCYKVKDKFKPDSLVSIVDQFGAHHAVKVLKPFLLCTSAKKCIETRCICADGTDVGPFMPTMPGDCHARCAAIHGLPEHGESLSCESSCGNGIVEAGCCEECDDGNTAGGDGCSPICQLE